MKMTNHKHSPIKLVCLGAKNPETIRVTKAVEKEDKNFSLMGFIDNDKNKWGKSFYGYKVLGGIDQVKKLAKKGVVFCNIITGSTSARYETSKEIIRHGGTLINLIHPMVNLDMVTLGQGNYIQDGVIIQAGVTIGDNSSIHIGSLISHQSIIGNSVFISFGVNVSGEVIIEDGVFMGAGSCVLPRLTIGKWSIVGAEAVVLKDVPPYSVVVGNPARIIKHTNINYSDGKIY